MRFNPPHPSLTNKSKIFHLRPRYIISSLPRQLPFGSSYCKSLGPPSIPSPHLEGFIVRHATSRCPQQLFCSFVNDSSLLYRSKSLQLKSTNKHFVFNLKHAYHTRDIFIICLMHARSL